MHPYLRILLVGFLVIYHTTQAGAQTPAIEALLAAGRYAEAATALEARGDRASVYRAGAAWIEIDSLDDALRTLKSVTRDRADRPLVDSLSGLAYHKMGVAAFNAYEDSLAIVYYLRALAIRDSVLPRYHNERAHTRANLAGVYNLYQRTDTAIVLLREANDIYEHVAEPDSLNWLRNLNQMTTFARTTRNYRLGYSSSYRAVSLLEQMDVDPRDGYLTYYNAAFVLMRLAEIEPALRYARKAVEQARRMEKREDLPDAINMLAIVEREAGQVRAGYRHLREAERLARATQDTASLGFIYLNLAEYYGGENDAANLDRYDALAQEYLRYGGLEGEYYGSEKIPAARLRMGQTEEALDLLTERVDYLGGNALDSILKDAKQVPPANIVPLIDMLGHRAEAYTTLDQPDRALDDYRLLFHLQNQLRHGVSDDVSRAYLSQDQRRFYDRAIALLLNLYRAEEEDDDLWEAFQLSERARAYSLLASVQSQFVGISPEVSALQAEISRLEREVSLGQSERQAELATARIRMDGLQAEQPRVNDISFALKRKRLNSFLKKDNVYVLQYHLSEQNTVLFLITPAGDLQVHNLDLDNEVATDVHAWRETIEASSYRLKSMASPEVQSELDSNYLYQGIDLAELLLPTSVRKVLRLRPAANHKTRICVVPDGVLNYLPFAALPLGRAALPLDYGELAYLQSAADVSYSYSTSYLLAVNEGPRKTYEKNFIAFAPTFRSDGEATADGYQSAKSLLRSNASLSPLAHSREEVATVLQMVDDGKAYFADRATVAQFRADAGKARVLHISSHGFVDPTDPNLSFIAFSQLDDTLRKDELLYLNDLYGLQIDNELTVLSACETAVGKLAVGETTLSMASAFAAAGARSTLTTLWQVDDAATKDLVVGFYRRLVEGDTRMDAINGAQRDMRLTADYAHPYYWSALTLYGASSPIELLGKGVTLSVFAWGVLWLGALVVLLLFIYFARGSKAYRNLGW